MRIRHKVPSVFNLYMVDVLCCALGCVIMVWQLDRDKVAETKRATQRKEDEASALLAATQKDRDAAQVDRDEAKQVLASTQVDRDEAKKLLASTQVDRDEAKKLLASTQVDRDEAKKLLREAENKAANLELTLNDKLVKFAAVLKQLNDREADVARLKTEIKNLKETLEERAAKVADLEKQLRENQAKADALAKAVADGAKQLKDSRAAAEKHADELEAARLALVKRATDQSGKLTEAEKKLLELAAQLASSEKKTKDLDKKNQDLVALADLLPGLKAKLAAAEKSMDDRADKLAESSRSLDKLKADHDQLSVLLKKERAALASAESKWKLYEDKVGTLENEIALGKRSLAVADKDLLALRAEKKTLEGEVVRVRQAADNRFAGITLTGRRVVFLIDMSGSMDLVDEKTPAPQKWTEVRNTVLKIMKSLPDLDKFQVIIFEESAAYLLGKPEEWIDYDAKTSPDRVEAALRAIKPKGGTNMYTPLEAAFRYRPRGLDTIYLLSDGLPNAGDGVPEAEAKRLLETGKEPELSERLAKHIRKALKTKWNQEIEKERVRINTIGFFYESPEVGAFLWALARENDGSFVGMSKP